MSDVNSKSATSSEWNNRPDRKPSFIKARILARVKKEGLIVLADVLAHFKGRFISDNDLMYMKHHGLIEMPKQVLRIPEGTLLGSRQSIYRKEVIEQIKLVLEYRDKGLTYTQIRKAMLEDGRKLPGITKKELYDKASDKK